MTYASGEIEVTREDKKEKRIPGESGIWVFVMGDMLIFALFFFVYLYYRQTDLALYQESQQALSKGMGLFNTVVLLSSSWCVARFIHYLRIGAIKVSRRYLQEIGRASCRERV